MAAGSLLPGTSIKKARPPDLFPKSAGFSRRKARGSFSRTTFEVQGLNTLVEHWATVAALTDALAPAVLDFYADVTVHNARQFVRKDTWATHDSIDKGGGVVRSAMGDYSVWMGASTLQARFLEYGTIKMPAYPFMIPAIDMIEKDFIRAFGDIAAIADTVTAQARITGDVGKDARVRSPISAMRSGLYSLSKALGDISVFGGREFLSPIRSFALMGARLLGDVDSVMRGTLNLRISRRLTGRATGRLRGLGSASLFGSKTYSGLAGGTGGQRIYNRFVGRISTPVVTGLGTRLGGF